MAKKMIKMQDKITRYLDYHDKMDSWVWIDIIECGDYFEAWLTPHDYGVSELMFGCSKKQSNGHDVDYDGFVEMVEANLEDYVVEVKY